ncbi:hypothetical protein O9K51_01195 [Purpureocillium lavendulum]|uniref:Uncharacterized protein n=1 Tax=Purpureocillium lavendulum TaxID=1247861 RepID=A0AB34G4M2_9HYPO|nr:hypothetical protein O9K51_01195 [Purpureocillium lavendulum]
MAHRQSQESRLNGISVDISLRDSISPEHAAHVLMSDLDFRHDKPTAKINTETQAIAILGPLMQTCI